MSTALSDIDYNALGKLNIKSKNSFTQDAIR